MVHMYIHTENIIRERSETRMIPESYISHMVCISKERAWRKFITSIHHNCLSWTGVEMMR